jgi:hypothetical protein
MSVRARKQLLLGIVVGMIVASVFMPRIAQDPAYHQFADQRTILGIPHFFDVISNVPFFFVGIWGFWAVQRSRFSEPAERWSYIVLFLGVTLTCFGSGWYHWEPNNQTLVWDRLPMTIGFIGLLAAMINERINIRLGTGLLLPLLAIGLASVFYWDYTEMRGYGDLRPYAFVQFGSLLLLLLLVTMFPPTYTRGKLIGGAIAFYGLAKLLEMADVPIFRITGGTVSGHTLKHLAAAGAIVWIVEMLTTRVPARIHLQQVDG